MSELILTALYLFLFIFSFYKKNYLFLALPIFVFCYPQNLNYINTSWGFGLDDLFILSHFLLTLSVNSNSNYPLLKRWKLINLGILVIFLFSNISGFAVDDFTNFHFLSFFKAAALFSYAYFICIIYCAKIISIKDIHQAKMYLIFAVFIQCLIAIAVYFFTEKFSFYYDSTDILKSGDVTFRAVGSLKGPWELGGVLSIGYVLVHTEIMSASKKTIWKQIYLGAILTLILYTVILSYSRASFLFILFSTLILLRRNPIKQLLFGLIIFIPVFLLFHEIFEAIITRLIHRLEFATKLNSGNLDNSSLSRFETWNRIFDTYNVFYFFTGYGWRNFQYYFGTTPHNGFLSLIISSGFFGLIVYYNFFKTLWQNRNVYLNYKAQEPTIFGILSIFAGLFFYSMTTDTLFTDAVFKMLTIIGSLVILQKSIYSKINISPSIHE